MDTNKRLNLIKEVGEEIVTEAELKTLLETKKHPIAYDGFEPSGQMHIAQGILRSINVNKMTKAGIKFNMLVADWFALMNNKLGGDFDKIMATGDYFIELWKACGMDLENVEFTWSKDLVHQEGHWKKTIDIARNSSLQRIIRTGQIMGRKSTDSLTAAQIIYPCMQAADIFQLKADITQLGMDQRKVNILAREVGPKLGFWKPVIVSHHMLLGLLEPKSASQDKDDRMLDLKMSKSKPDSAIFMTDSEADVKRKIAKAYCPEKQAKENPIMEYNRYIVFEKFDALEIKRPEKFGGDLNIGSYAELEKIYTEGKLHPIDLKAATAASISKILEEVMKNFNKSSKAKKLAEQVKSFEITR